MKKVLVICGSPRPNGNTAQIANECAKVIENNGVLAEVISFAGKKIESCTACYPCKDLGECSIDDGLNEIIKNCGNPKASSLRHRSISGLLVAT